MDRMLRCCLDGYGCRICFRVTGGFKMIAFSGVGFCGLMWFLLIVFRVLWFAMVLWILCVGVGLGGSLYVFIFRK